MVPWELLYCVQKRKFVADHWIVYRWCYGAAAPEQVGEGPACYVLPNNAPQAARDEVASLLKIIPSKTVWATLEDLLGGLNEAEMGLLHIAAHNMVNYENESGTYLKLNERFLPVMLTQYAESDTQMKNSPLVFLNACSSAAPTDHWIGATSWASRFLSAGSGAFVGSLWEIRDESALIFAQAFYAHVQKGFNLGAAFQAARAAIPKTGDPTRLAYTFFGSPDAVLTKGVKLDDN